MANQVWTVEGGPSWQESSDEVEVDHNRSLIEDSQPILEQPEHRKRRGRHHSSEETLGCPTCQGTGRIPRGQESKLVAVIPCNDQRLEPRHTKLYVAVSVALCLLVCCLVLFFLFPRSVILSPVAVQSVYVHFSVDSVQMNITNGLNITNQNYAGVQAYNLSVQALNYKTVVGTADIPRVASIKPLSNKLYSFEIPIKLTDEGLNVYCRSTTTKVHTLFLHLQMSMTVYYLAHFEQLSLDTYEYIDCGANTTVPHSVHPAPGQTAEWMDQ